MKLLKKEKTELFEKVTKAIGAALRKNSTHTDREISEITGISTNRITEYKNHEKYGRVVTETHLAELLGGGIFTMEEIIEEITAESSLTDKELEALRQYGMYEDKVLRKNFFNAMKKGIDVVALLRAANEAAEAGLDPVELLKK